MEASVVTNLPPLIRVQAVKPELPEGGTLFMVFVYMVFVQPAMLMVGMGAAHTLWPTVVPAAGYTTCLLMRLGLGVLKSGHTPGWGR